MNWHPKYYVVSHFGTDEEYVAAITLTKPDAMLIAFGDDVIMTKEAFDAWEAYTRDS